MPQKAIQDSLNHLNDSIPVASIASDLFQHHLLLPRNKAILPHQITSNVLELVITLFCSCVLVYLFISQPKKIILVFKSFFSLSQTRQLVREDYRLNKGISISLLTVFVLMMAYFLHIVNLKYHIVANTALNTFSWYITICFVILLVYFVKYILHKLLAFLLDSGEEIKEYIFSVFMMNKAVGVFLLPIIIISSFSSINKEISIYIGMALCALFYVIRLFRGFSIGYLSRGLSIFHLFLYLCGLEFLPFAVIIKLLVGKML